jgi:hypothetical protein
MRTEVAIIGAGPAALLLSHPLSRLSGDEPSTTPRRLQRAALFYKGIIDRAASYPRDEFIASGAQRSTASVPQR